MGQARSWQGNTTSKCLLLLLLVAEVKTGIIKPRIKASKDEGRAAAGGPLGVQLDKDLLNHLRQTLADAQVVKQQPAAASATDHHGAHASTGQRLRGRASGSDRSSFQGRTPHHRNMDGSSTAHGEEGSGQQGASSSEEQPGEDVFTRTLFSMLSRGQGSEAMTGPRDSVDPQPGPNKEAFGELYSDRHGTYGFNISRLKESEVSHRAAPDAHNLYVHGGPASGRMPLHWVITSCNRTFWGRHLASTMLSGWLMDVRPSTVTVLMCSHMPSGRLPTLIHNLRFSQRVHFVYLPPGITHSFITNYMLALSIPFYLGAPHIPLLVTEDDVVFTPNFNRKLRAALQTVRAQHDNKPYILNLYGGAWGDVVRGTMPTLDMYRQGTRPGMNAVRRGPTEFELSSGSNAFAFGCQGMLYPPSMYQHLLYHFLQVHSGFHDKNRKGPQDLVIREFMERFNCLTDTESRCIVLRVAPALIEHVGVSSSYFGGINNKSRFHMSDEFPWRVEFPALDPEAEWRRRRRRRGA